MSTAALASYQLGRIIISEPSCFGRYCKCIRLGIERMEFIVQALHFITHCVVAHGRARPFSLLGTSS